MGYKQHKTILQFWHSGLENGVTVQNPPLLDTQGQNQPVSWRFPASKAASTPGSWPLVFTVGATEAGPFATTSLVLSAALHPLTRTAEITWTHWWNPG